MRQVAKGGDKSHNTEAWMRRTAIGVGIRRTLWLEEDEMWMPPKMAKMMEKMTSTPRMVLSLGLRLGELIESLSLCHLGCEGPLGEPPMDSGWRGSRA